MMLFRAICAALLFATAAAAQDYPDYRSTYVNDFADLLPGEEEAAITDQLRRFREAQGIEMTVVTIDTRANYGDSPSIERFATGLFNAWGIGDASRNDGVMVLVSRADREIRVELGAGWDAVHDDRVKIVIDDVFLPYFRRDDYAGGITAGVGELITRLSPGYQPSKPESDPIWPFVVMGISGLIIAFRRRIGDRLVGLKRCPNCGRRMLSRGRDMRRRATRETAGEESITTACRNCDYRRFDTRTVPYRSSSSGGSFGGGSSSGGGASGRW